MEFDRGFDMRIFSILAAAEVMLLLAIFILAT